MAWDKASALPKRRCRSCVVQDEEVIDSLELLELRISSLWQMCRIAAETLCRILRQSAGLPAELATRDALSSIFTSSLRFSRRAESLAAVKPAFQFSHDLVRHGTHSYHLVKRFTDSSYCW